LSWSKFKNLRFTDLLLFGAALPIIVYSAILHEGRLTQDLHIIYLGIFSLLGLWLLGQLVTGTASPASRDGQILAASFLAFYLLCFLQLLFFLMGWGFTTHDPYGTYKALPLVWAHLLLFLFFYSTFRSPAVIKNFLNCIFALAATLAFLGLLQDIIPNVWRKNMFFVTKINFDFYGTFFSNDRFAFFLNLILPFAAATTLWELMTRYSWKRPLATALHILRRPLALKIVGVLIIGIATGWTGSRSGALAIGIVTSLMVLVFFLITWKRVPDKLGFLVTLLVLTAIAVPLLLSFTGVPNALKQVYWWYCRIADILTGNSSDPSYTERLLAYRSILPAIAAHPIFGFGLGSFQAAFPAFKSPLLGQATWNHAHNEYLELIFETGLAGLTLLILFPFLLLLRKVRTIFRTSTRVSSEQLILIISILGGLLTAGIHSGSDFSLKYSTCMMIFLSLGAALFATVGFPISTTQTAPSRPDRLFYLSLLLVTILNVVAFELPFQAAQKTRLLAQAVQLDPLDPQYRLELLKESLSYGSNTFDQHEFLEKKIVQISPKASTYAAIAELLGQRGFIDETFFVKASEYYKKAIELDPIENTYLLGFISDQLRLAERAAGRNETPDLYLDSIKKTLNDRTAFEGTIGRDLKEAITKLIKQSPYQSARDQVLAMLSSDTQAH